MKKYICSNCGSLSNYSYSRGDGCFSVLFKLIFHILFFLMLFTPLFWVSLLGWAIWLVIACSSGRRSENCCPHCKAENTLMLTDSPKGKELLEQYHPNLETDEEKEE